MENKDFVLLAVAAGRSLTPVQLQKSLFLISQGLPGGEGPSYEFDAYHYGPFNAAIYRDAEELQEDGLVIRVPTQPGGWAVTLITLDGAEQAAALRKNDPDLADQVDAVVNEVQSLSFGALLTRIYRDHPAYAKNSVFQGR